MKSIDSHFTLRFLVLVMAFTLVAGACSSSSDDAPTDTAPSTSDVSAEETDGDEAGRRSDDGPLRLTLDEGEPAEVEITPVAQVVDGEPLDQAEVDEIHDRLGELPTEPDDEDDFRRPDESLPPPRAGEKVETPFPADGTNPPPPVDNGPLEVLRYQPDGDVPIAPSVSVTFNQPMVPITTLGQLDAEDVPVMLEPAIPGRWEWIGTRTIRFEHTSDLIDRLPMATMYTVTVPAGTESENGGTLSEAVTWTFSTPAPQLRSISPGGHSLPLEPVFVATFDQHVDPAAILSVTTLTGAGDGREIRVATEEEIAEDDDAHQLVERTPEGRFVAFRAVDAFEPDTPITITIGSEIPSAEGPTTNPEPSIHEVSTYAPLRVVGHSCDDEPCDPERDQIGIEFNNELDVEAFDETMVTIEPELEGAYVLASYNGISVRGAWQPETTYTVTLDPEITDVFDQHLGDADAIDLEFGRSRPSIRSFGHNLTTVDPTVDDPIVSIGTVGHDELRVTIYDVGVEDWPAYSLSDDRSEDGWTPPWPVLSTETVSPADADRLSETQLALADALEAGGGHVVVVVESTTEYSRDDEAYWNNRPALTWAQSSRIGLDAFVDDDRLIAWTTDLETGTPLEGVTVEVANSDSVGSTDGNGLTTIPLPDSTSDDSDHLIARQGDESSILPSFLGRVDHQDGSLWYVIDDRGTYRPGETARFKGWVRELTLTDDAQLALPEDEATVAYVVRDAEWNELASGSAELNALGGFDFEAVITPGANLGVSYVEFSGPFGTSSGYTHEFRIQEFRRPEFEVATRVETPGPYTAAEPATVAVDATYYAGGPLPDAEVEWAVTTQRTTYDPPNWEDYTFGIWEPIWYNDYFYGGFEGEYYDDIGPYEEPPEPERFTGRTGPDGTHLLEISLRGDDEGQATSMTAEATVYDVNRQAWASSTDLLVHPGDFYVGIRSDQTFVEKGDELIIEGVVVDIDGGVVTDREVVVEASRLEWRYEDGEWAEVPVDTQTCTTTSTDEPFTCEFGTDTGGTYQIDATVSDDDGRESLSRVTRWVSGGESLPVRGVEQEQLTLVPDAESYQPGDVAEILVEAPFTDGEGLVTVARNGILSTERFTIDGTTATIEVPIEDRHIPNLFVQVDLVGSSVRTGDDGTELPDLPARPAYASGQLNLDIPPAGRTLTVDAEPAEDTVEPGGDTTVDVTVTGPGGQPVAGAEMTVVVVDEAVLALSGYELLDPTEVFYGPIPPNFFTEYARRLIELTDPDRLDSQAPPTTTALGDGEEDSTDAPGEVDQAGAADEGAAPESAAARNAFAPGENAIEERANFDALAVFEPDVVTDAAGKATIAVPLPDNLTRYRVMVVAVDGADRFGSTESNIRAQLPLMARPSAPRFLNFGDAFELPVVVQNNTDAAMTVDVAIDATNLTLTDTTGKRITVPADDRVEVRFDAEADEVGTARFRIAAVSGPNADAVTTELPVYTPATAEAFATYGVVDDGAIVQSINAPERVFPQFGGLEIGTSSTALHALTDAVLYLYEYPYASADAYASRILAVAALRDVLEAFDAEGLPDAAELDASVADDIDGLLALQNPDGGFAGWDLGRPSDPFRSIQATHALVEARTAGYPVAEGSLTRALDYLRFIEDHFPPEMSEMTRDTLSAYALHVRNLSGDRDAAKADRLHADAGDELALDGLAWLWPVVDDPNAHAEIERRFANAATETAGAATFSTDYGDDAYVLLYSDRRTDGIVLDALISEDPTSDLIPKVVTGLLGNQTQGRWDNVQENSFILLALNRYFDTFESVDPDFIARVWLGDTYAAEHTYSGRTTDRGHTLVPMSELVGPDDGDVIVAKDGAGRLYYRLGMRYAPEDLVLDPLDRGFVVARSYEAIDDPEDVRRDEDGTWHIRAGATVRVKLAMVADSRRTNMALIDPLPAGLEPLNPDLAVTPDLPIEEIENDIGIEEFPSAATFDVFYPWWGPWYEHENLRDDRVEAISSLLPAGTYDYRYVARATTPGTFVVPPARAEEIYAPETFGRTATDTVIVE